MQQRTGRGILLQLEGEWSMKLLGVSGTLIGSKTLAVVKRVLYEANALDPTLETELLDLKQLDLPFCDGRNPADYTGDAAKVIKLVTEADMLVIGTPVFQGSITGALKNVFDLLPVDAMRQKPVGLVATGGSQQHYLVIETQLRPILGYFRAFVAPGHVYVHNEQFLSTNELSDSEIIRRVKVLAQELILMKPLTKLGEVRV